MNQFKMLSCLLAGLIIIVSHAAIAQYNTSIGIRLGGTTGLTIKHSYRPSMTFEGILGGFPSGFSVTGLIEKNKLAFGERGLSWYYGGGAHVAVYNGRNYYNHFGREFSYSTNNELGFGINGIIGLEYRLPDNIPIAFSADLKPFLEITSGGNAGLALDPSIGIEFIIK